MDRVLIGDLQEHVGKDVTIYGWVDSVRDHGKVAFVVLRDRSGYIQAVASNDYNTTVLPQAQTLREQCVVSLTGEVKERPEKMRREEMNGSLEFGIKEVRVLSEAGELPFALSAELNLDTLLDYRPLTLRRERERAIFKVQHEILRAYRAFLIQEGFIEFQAPKLVGDDAEGGGNVFKIDYFNDKVAFLATSPQLYKQMMVGVFERVFSIGNVFRAEKHSTTRHLNEYTSLDAEFGFIQDHHDIMRLETRLMGHIVAHLESECATEFALLGATLPKTPEQFPHMKLREAQELIYKETGKDVRDEPDLEPEDERWLSEYALTHFDSDFIFITHYPAQKRPFYTYEDEADPGYTKSFDLLFRGVEITTGGQRIHRYETYIENIRRWGLKPENFAFYLQAFKYGMPPHGGWGMGLERLTQKLLSLRNVKEATLFPRDMNRIDTRLSDDDS